MKIRPFKLERFFAEYEFNLRYQISASDCQTMSVGELLEMSDHTGEDHTISSLRMGYTESRGSKPLRKAIAGTYRGMEEDSILVAAPEEAIFLTIETYLESEDHVIVMTPAYQSLLSLPQSIGCRVTEWPVELIEGRWRIDLDFLKDHLTDATRMVILNIPHNPTGLCLTLEEKKQIVELLRPTKTLLFADEMYYRLEYDPEVSGTSFADLYENAISLSGLSKSYGLPGLRIGWLASPSVKLLEPIASMKDYTTICNSAPSELLGLIAVENAGRIIHRNLDIVKTNLEQLTRLSQRLPDTLNLNLGGGGSVVFPSLTAGRSAKELSRRLIEQRSLLLLPGHLFEMPNHFFRLGLGRTDFPEALHILEEELS